jgi:protein-S-isoprenylcysteine O-methyltransferase Ste14
MKLISRIAGLFILLLLLMLLVRGDLFSRSPLVILGQVAALGLLVWARASFNPGQFRVVPAPAEGPLLIRGPYRFLRHPMYAGASLLLWSSILGHWSWLYGALALTASAGVAVRIIDEERALREHFPGYAEYSQRIRRLIPYVF